MKFCCGRVSSIWCIGLVWFLFFWVRSWSKCFIHSFLLWSFFYCPRYYLRHSSRHTHLLYVFFSHLQCPAMSCYVSSLLSNSAMMIVRSLSCAFPLIHCPTRLNRHVVTFLFFHTPKTSLRLSRCNSKLPCLSTDVFRNIVRRHLISPHYHAEGIAAESYVVFISWFCVSNHVRSQGFFVSFKDNAKLCTRSLLSLFYTAMSSPSFCLVL